MTSRHPNRTGAAARRGEPSFPEAAGLCALTPLRDGLLFLFIRPLARVQSLGRDVRAVRPGDTAIPDTEPPEVLNVLQGFKHWAPQVPFEVYFSFRAVFEGKFNHEVTNIPSATNLIVQSPTST